MIELARPTLLLLAIPWLAGCGLFARIQLRALEAVERQVDERFRGHFTRHSRRSLGWHLTFLALLGLLPILAAARPGIEGRGEMIAGGRLLLLIDASASMYAEDVNEVFEADEPPDNRFEQARRIAAELTRRLEGMELAIATFSGSAAINLPMTRDRAVVEEALRVLEEHGYYRNTGSSFGGALDLAFHFFRPEDPGLQVVMISDGEMPFPESFEEPLAVLAENRIPVHAITVGSKRGQKRRIFDFSDIVAGRKPPRVIRSFTTRRVDEHLEEMALRTGGRFGAASIATVEAVEEAIREAARSGRRAARDEVRTELAALPLLLFLLGFLLEALVPWPRRRAGSFDFDLDRVGELPRPATPGRRTERPASAVTALCVLLALLFVAACDRAPRRRAHRDNERGIALDRIGRHRAARPHYERSIAAGERPQIPIYNLARSLTLAGDFAEAHEVFQQALRIAPDLRQAYFNDGVALYRWGAVERDPRNCELERTRELWEGALRRFESVADADLERTPLGDSARADRDHVAAEMAALRALIADPPEECGSSSRSSSSASGGPGEAGADGKDGEDGDPGNGGGEGESEGEGAPGEHGGGTGSDATGAGGGLTASELEEIDRALARIDAQAREAGKYHRRTLAEQFRKEDWENPDAVVWW